MKNVLLLTFLFFMNSALAEEMQNAAADMKKAEKIVKELGINLSDVNIRINGIQLLDLVSSRFDKHFSGPDPAFYLRTVKPVTFKGQLLPAGSGLFYAGGSYQKLYVANKSEFNIDGFSCNEVVNFRDERLCNCSLSKDHKKTNFTLPKRSKVFLKNGVIQYVYLPDSNHLDKRTREGHYTISEDGTFKSIDPDKVVYHPCIRENPSKIYSCEAGTKYPREVMLNGMIDCCLESKSTGGKCYREGPNRIVKIDDWTRDQSRHQETFYKDNKKNGKFTEWLSDEKSKKVEGQYADDNPVGSWKFLESNGASHYKIEYGPSGGMIGFALPLESGVKQRFETVVQTPVLKPYGRVIGIENPKISIFPKGRDSNPNDLSYGHMIFYSSWDKKKVVGAAISDYRFFSNHICYGWCDIISVYGNYEWPVYEKKEEMCKSFLPASDPTPYVINPSRSYYPVWYECNNFEDIVKVYRSGNYGIGTKSLVYDKPNGNLITLNFVTTNLLEIDLQELKVVDGMVWVKGDFSPDEHQCPSEEIDEIKSKNINKPEGGVGWVPFYVGDELNLVRIFSQPC